MSLSERSYVIYAPTAWEGQAQPLHNLAAALSLHHRVLYVDPAVSPLSPFRYGLRGATAAQLRTVVSRRSRRHGDVNVFSPLVLPPVEHPRMRALSLPLLRAQVATAVRHAGLQRPVVLAAHRLAEMRGVADESLRLGIFVDHPTAGATLMGRSAAAMEAEATVFCGAADLMLAMSRPLVELVRQWGWDCELIAAGFPKQLADRFDRAAEPPEYAALPRPLLGYTGGIDDRLDYDMIVRLADHFALGSLVFVGSMSPRLSGEARAALSSRANIHLLGRKPQRELAGYIRHLDVALMPYEDTPFTHFQSPMKVWEYLYAGPPIVGAGSIALRSYPPPLVNYAESVAEAVALVEAGLAEPQRGRAQRRSFALANTWEHRAAQLDAIAAQRLESKGLENPAFVLASSEHEPTATPHP